MEQQTEGTGGDLDAVLQSLGGGRHRLVTGALLALVYATGAIYNVNYVFAVEDTGYRCALPTTCSTNSSILPQPTDSKQCHQYAISDGCQFDHNILQPCTQWVYDVPDSFVAEFGLACEEWKLSLVGTAHSLGSALGLVFQGQISDRFGRKTATVFAGSMAAVLGLTKSFVASYWLYVLLELLEAAIGDALSPVFMLSVEIVEKKRAVLFQMILLNCYTSGLIILPWISKAVPYWRHFLRVIYAPMLLAPSYSLLLDESVRWLYSKGKRDRAINILNKIAKRNGMELDKEMLNRLDYVGEVDSDAKNDRKLLLKTLKSRVMRQRLAVCLVWWVTITLINYGMMISAVHIAGDKYANFSLLMLMDIISNVCYWLALNKYKRKLPLIASFLLGGVFCVAQPFVPTEHAWLGLLLYMSFEALATFSSNIVYMYTSELFPTYTRNSVHALCAAVGRAGSLLAPQTPLLMFYWRGLPALLFGLSSLLSGCLTLLMPETAHSALPDTVAAAERIGRKTSHHMELRNLKPLLDTEHKGRRTSALHTELRNIQHLLDAQEHKVDS